MEEQEQGFNLKDELTDKDIQIIKKLECEIHNGLYNEFEYIRLKESLGIYHSSYNEDPENKYKKPFKYGVNKKDFDYICSKFNEIDNKYSKILNNIKRKIGFDEIWLSDKQHIRDKLIIALKQNKLNDIQKEKILKIITNMENASLKQKERFIMYFGLDNKKIKVHDYKEIAKQQKCSSSNIRQAIRTVSSKIVRLSDKEIDEIRKILK